MAYILLYYRQDVECKKALPFLQRVDFLVFLFNFTLLARKLSFYVLDSEKQTKREFMNFFHLKRQKDIT